MKLWLVASGLLSWYCTCHCSSKLLLPTAESWYKTSSRGFTSLGGQGETDESRCNGHESYEACHWCDTDSGLSGALGFSGSG